MKNKIVIIFIFVFSFSTFCFAQATNVGQLNVRNFSPKEYQGLPQTFQAVEDSRGVLFVTNNMGLYEYNGTDWNLLKLKNDAAAISCDITDTDTIYIGSRDDEFGYFSIEKEKYTYHSLSESLKEIGSIFNTQIFKDFVCFQGRKSIYIYKDGKVKTFEMESNIRSIQSLNNELNVFTKTGIFLYRDGKFIKNPLFNFSIDLDLLGGFEQSSKKFIFYSKSIIYVFQDGILKEFSNLTIGSLFGLKLDENHFLISTEYKGVHLYNIELGLLEVFDEKYGLQNQNCHKIFLSENRELIIPTEFGFSTIDLSSKLKLIDVRNGFKGRVENIYKTNNSIFFAGNEGLFELKNNEISKKYESEVWDVLQANNTLILALSSEIVSFSNNKKEVIASCYPWCLHRSKVDPNYIIVGLDPGLMFLKFNGKAWVVDTVFEDTDSYRHIEEDDNGNLWMASNTDGIGHFKPDFKNLKNTVKHYVGEEFGLGEGDVKAEFNGAKMYFASFRNGLLEFDEKSQKFKKTKDYGAKLFEFNRSITRMKFDAKGRLWANLAYGPAENEFGYVNEDKEWVKDEFSNIYEMVISIETTDNIVWIGTTQNIYAYEVQSKNTNSKNKKITLISQVARDKNILVVDNSLRKEQELMVFDFNKEEIYFKFSRPQYSTSEGVEYSYFLEGLNSAWSEWDSKNKAGFTNLPEGKYIFNVKSRINNSSESEIAQFEFEILPPWYRTWWAMSLYIVVGFLIVYLFFKWRTQALKIRQKELEDEVGVRTLEVVEQKKEAEKQRDMVEHQNHEITASINYASRIQAAVLTSEELWEKAFSDFFVFFKPRDIVSGDYYWLFETEDGKVIWAAADCTGHGVPGGFMSMLGMSFLNEIVIENNILVPHLILNNLRSKIIKAFEEKGGKTERKDGMDISLCVLDKKTNLIQFAGAYNPMLVIRKTSELPKEIFSDDDFKIIDFEDKSLVEFKANKMPVAKHLLDQESFTTTEFQLQKGDRVYTMTDGFIDQFGGELGKKYMSKNFKKYLLEIQDTPVKEQHKLLGEEFLNWLERGKTSQIDDVCVVGIEI